MFAKMASHIEGAAPQRQPGGGSHGTSGFPFLEPVNRVVLFLEQPLVQAVGERHESIACGDHVQTRVRVLEILAKAFQLLGQLLQFFS